MNKNYQQMMKNDKKNDKKLKKTRDIHHFWFFPKRPEFIIFLSIFYRFSSFSKETEENE